MSNIPDTLRYAKSHEWLILESDGTAVIGISDYAQSSLGDITYVQVPGVGEELTAGGPLGVVESVKAASDIYAPIGGTVIEVNADLDVTPEKVNQEPYEGGWLVKIKVSDPTEAEALLDASAYEQEIS
ncbi:MAG: glycine cleavage system protein H [Opitutaceae bacterium]|nr:glycine cleavage system protein H [Opitutaceae bacterium]